MDESSLWYPVKDKFDLQQDTAATAGMDPAEFAKRLADQILVYRKGTV